MSRAKNLIIEYQDYGNYQSGDGIIEHSGFNRISFGSYFDIYPDKNRTIELKFLGNIGENTGYPALPMDAEKDEGFIGLVSYTQKNLTKNWSLLSSKVYFNKVNHVMNNKLRSNYSMMQMETIGHMRTFGGDLVSNFTSSDKSLKAGIDFYQTNGDATRTMMMTFRDWPDATIRDIGVFAEYQSFLTSQVLFRSGLRSDLSQASAKEISDGYMNYWNLGSIPAKKEADFSGNLSVTYEVNGKLTAGGSIAKGNRIPEIAEYYSYYSINRFDNHDYIGNPELNNESNTNFELQFKLDYDAFQTEVSGYWNLIENYIVGKVLSEETPKTSGANGVQVYQNLGQAEVKGIEGNWKLRLPYGLRLLGNMSYTVGQDKENDEPLPEISPFETTLGLKYMNSKNKSWLQVNSRFVAEQNRISTITGEDKAPAFQVFDLRIGYTKLEHFQIFAGIENIFNESYYEHLNRNNILSQGRNIYLIMKLTS